MGWTVSDWSNIPDTERTWTLDGSSSLKETEIGHMFYHKFHGYNVTIPTLAATWSLHTILWNKSFMLFGLSNLVTNHSPPKPSETTNKNPWTSLNITKHQLQKSLNITNKNTNPWCLEVFFLDHFWSAPVPTVAPWGLGPSPARSSAQRWRWIHPGHRWAPEGRPSWYNLTNAIITMWGPLVISWFISLNNYSYKYHKP